MPTIFHSYLAALFLILSQRRKYGNRSLDDDARFPDRSDIFQAYPELRDYPIHFEFVRDMMRMMAAGLSNADLQDYADAAQRAFLQTESPDVALWDLIQIALLSDSTPHSAVEFARQAIPFALRPSYAELQAMTKQVGRDYAAQTEAPPEPLTARVAAWFAREDR